MNSVAIDSDKTTKTDQQAAHPTRKRKGLKKGKPGKKTTNTVAGKAADATNKKAAVIALMKRAKGATLAEIMEATGWQPHTVRGFVSILGSKGGEKVESSKSATGERVYRMAK